MKNTLVKKRITWVAVTNLVKYDKRMAVVTHIAYLGTEQNWDTAWAAFGTIHVNKYKKRLVFFDSNIQDVPYQYKDLTLAQAKKIAQKALDKVISKFHKQYYE